MNEKFKTTVVNYSRCLLTIYSLVPRGAGFLTLDDISLSIGARNILRQRKKIEDFQIRNFSFKSGTNLSKSDLERKNATIEVNPKWIRFHLDG